MMISRYLSLEDILSAPEEPPYIENRLTAKIQPQIRGVGRSENKHVAVFYHFIQRVQIRIALHQWVGRHHPARMHGKGTLEFITERGPYIIHIRFKSHAQHTHRAL